MGNVLTRNTVPTNMSNGDNSKSEWDDSHDYASTLHVPISQPSDAIIEATERGMIGENCLSVSMFRQTEVEGEGKFGDWPLRSADTKSTSTTSTNTDSRLEENEHGGQRLCFDCAEEKADTGRSLEEGGRRVWSGVDERGCRHVRWKGLNA